MLGFLEAPGIPDEFLNHFPVLASATPALDETVVYAERACAIAGEPAFATVSGSYADMLGALDVPCRARWGTPLLNARDEILAIASPLGPSDVVGASLELTNIMAAWDARESEDITRWWCTHATAQVLWVDLEGDLMPDAICHDIEGGFRWRATIIDGLMQDVDVDTELFCAGSGFAIYAGDFDGDARSDTLCHDKNEGTVAIDYAQNGFGIDWTSSLGTSWCNGIGDTLLLGDFDLDGRTDLLCRRPSGIQIDRARVDGSFDFSIDTVDQIASSWCTETDARLYAGDFDADERTDLLCLRSATGSLALQFARSETPLFTGSADEISEGLPPGFCAEPGDLLQIFDADGDGASDLYCRDRLGSTTESFRSRPGRSGVQHFVFVDDPSTDIDESRRFGLFGTARPRRVHAAAQPYPHARSL
jgi:hypothetical protein